MKNNCSLFERLFKKNENGIFLFGIPFFRFIDIDVFYYALYNKTSYSRILIGSRL